MKLFNAASQQVLHYIYDASGAVTAGGTAQLVLAQSLSRSFLFLENTSSANLTFEFDSARATCAISGGAVTSGGFTITNAGFGFTYPPLIEFMGGGNAGVSNYLGLAQPNAASPGHAAKAHAVLTGGAVSSIVLDDPGAGYVLAPFMLFTNDPRDPNGCALPTATTGIVLASGGSMTWNGTACPTGPISVYGGTTAQTFTCKWMD
jgi:hypothetical protein